MLGDKQMDSLLESSGSPTFQNPRERLENSREKGFPKNFGRERLLGSILTGNSQCPRVVHVPRETLFP